MYQWPQRCEPCRHGLSPESWGSQERFFFTVPQQRRRRPPPPPPPSHDKFFVGDPSQCTTGSCEFFLFCWLGGGVVEGGCGGFLQSCCNRPNQVGAKTIVTQVGPKLHAHFSFSLPASPFVLVISVFFFIHYVNLCGEFVCFTA